MPLAHRAFRDGNQRLKENLDLNATPVIAPTDVSLRLNGREARSAGLCYWRSPELIGKPSVALRPHSSESGRCSDSRADYRGTPLISAKKITLRRIRCV